MDVQICSVIKSTVHTSLKPIFCPHEYIHKEQCEQWIKIDVQLCSVMIHYSHLTQV